jgi:hypothetical protein
LIVELHDSRLAGIENRAAYRERWRDGAIVVFRDEPNSNCIDRSQDGPRSADFEICVFAGSMGRESVIELTNSRRIMRADGGEERGAECESRPGGLELLESAWPLSKDRIE